ncbi:MAG: nitrous oxide-stimulated promoter family protein [Hespellia sp.]|nr:nitrous oxide-stimulated promoter family protein [Hespellia sp.]
MKESRKINHSMKEKKTVAVDRKRKREERVVEEMIVLYCQKNHPAEDRVTDRGPGSSQRLCPVCQKLRDYAVARSEHCPFMEQKTFCANCKVHCYKPEMRELIRKVMKFSGPRMLFYHPGMALWHVVCSLWEKNKVKEKEKETNT